MYHLTLLLCTPKAATFELTLSEALLAATFELRLHVMQTLLFYAMLLCLRVDHRTPMAATTAIRWHVLASEFCCADNE